MTRPSKLLVCLAFTLAGWMSVLLVPTIVRAEEDVAPAATYVSLTEHQGRRILLYPDRKGYLSGKYLPDEWLDELKVQE